MYYKIRNTLEEIRAEEIFDGEECYVAVVSPKEWTRDKEKFNMGIDLEFETENLFMTKAEVNYDSLTGSFIIPDRSDLLESSSRFLPVRAFSKAKPHNDSINSGYDHYYATDSCYRLVWNEL